MEDQGREGGNHHLPDFQTPSHKEVRTTGIPCSSPTEKLTFTFTRCVPSINFGFSNKPVSILFFCINPVFPLHFSLTGIFSQIKQLPLKAAFLRAADRKAEESLLSVNPAAIPCSYYSSNSLFYSAALFCQRHVSKMLLSSGSSQAGGKGRGGTPVLLSSQDSKQLEHALTGFL